MIVTFQKGESLRYIGHLDLMRSWQRALRRSGLPIRYSNGFNPHILLSFASPLTVGVAGLREIMDVPMAQEISPDQMVSELNKVLPDCLQAVSARRVEDDFPTLMALVAASDFSIQVSGREAASALCKAQAAFMELDELVLLRKTKSGENDCNIRPFVLNASCECTDSGATLRFLVDCNNQGSVKPQLLIKALCRLAGIDEPPYIAYRERIMAREKGTLIPLETYGEADAF